MFANIGLTRRGAFAVAAPLLAAPSALAATPIGNTALDYVRLRADPAGAPVYWLSRGVRYLLADFQLTPLHAMTMASAVVAGGQGDGSFVVRALEAAYATDLAPGDLIDGFMNPVSGRRVALAAAPPQVVGYHYFADGRMALPRDDARKMEAEFRGALAMLKPFAGALAVEERFSVRTQTPSGVSDLAEQVTFTGDSEGRATKTVVVLRNWPFDAKRPEFTLLATYQGRRFATFDEFLAEIGPGKLEIAQPGFAERLAAFR
jgi:hypothetical protein